MKKQILLAALLLVSMSAVAQDSSKWAVKIRGGAEWSTLTGDEAKDEKNDLGWTLGAEAEYRLSDRFSISGGLQYARLKGKSDEVEVERDSYYEFRTDHVKYMREYIQMPVLLNVYLLKGLALKAGIQPALRIGSKMEYRLTGWYDDNYGNGTTPDITDLNWTEKAGMNNVTHQMAFDIPVGISYEFHNVVLDARYHWGLSHVFKNGSDIRMRCLTVTLGYKFNM